jgi:two-component system NarL family response regulator
MKEEVEKIRVLLADDDPIFRTGLSRILSMEKEIEIIGEASNGEEAVKMAIELAPDVMLLDIKMPKLSGIEAAKLIKKESPRTEVIIITISEDEEHVFKAIKAGASGYLLKGVSSDEVVKAIKTVFKGEALLSPSIAIRLLKEFKKVSEEKPAKNAENLFSQLSAREKSVLTLIVEGKSNKEIANALFISEKTVKCHVSNILQKLQVNDRTQAAIVALKQKIV